MRFYVNSSAALAASFLVLGCAGSPLQFGSERISYANPPSINSVLHPAPRLVTCTTTEGARYMAETGFFIAGCQPLPENQSFRVVSCEHIKLAEGGMWLIEAVGAEDTRLWVPVPWHDWA